MYWYLDDNGDDYFVELVFKCPLGAQILLWFYIHKWDTVQFIGNFRIQFAVIFTVK